MLERALENVESAALIVRDLALRLDDAVDHRDAMIRQAAGAHTERDVAIAAKLSAPRVHQIVTNGEGRTRTNG